MTAPHPKTTPAQRRVITTEGVHLIGWDEKSRPVVEGMFGIPNQLRRWAILRNGDPTDVTGEVSSRRDWS